MIVMRVWKSNQKQSSKTSEEQLECKCDTDEEKKRMDDWVGGNEWDVGGRGMHFSRGDEVLEIQASKERRPLSKVVERRVPERG
jgi:hypothetical protein